MFLANGHSSSPSGSAEDDQNQADVGEHFINENLSHLLAKFVSVWLSFVLPISGP